MPKPTENVTLTIDGKVLTAERGQTILHAARENGIYIPTLCYHPELVPFGGCRLCLVEVDGMRGFPTSCTTPVEAGMVIRTETAQLQQERGEILSLILSEHPSSCLICDERKECRAYMTTIRKVGVTSGCGSCPNDDQCEMQTLVERVGLTEMRYPVRYRGLPVEKEDPFFDRDYNLCILCGRCVRMCQEVRLVGTLAFKQRGPRTIIGPAFDRSHIDAGCEFCGACVSVCPTGSLEEKTRKWDGKPDREELSTCALCGVGCQLRVLVKGNRVMGTLPADQSTVDRQLCVKGRFSVTELVNNHERLKKPYKVVGGNPIQIGWDEAVNQAAEKLNACASNDFGFVVSADCSNEDLYIAQKFARVVMGTHNIDTTARLFYGSAFDEYLKLMELRGSLADLDKASAILCVGLDTQFGRSVVGLAARRAMKRGATLVTINARSHSLGRVANYWLQPSLGEEGKLLERLLDRVQQGTEMSSRRNERDPLDEKLNGVCDHLSNSSSVVILVGPDLLHQADSANILQTIRRLAQHLRASVLALPAQSNLRGSIMMGTYPELLPGGRRISEKPLQRLAKQWNEELPQSNSSWTSADLHSGKQLKVLYMMGDAFQGHARLAEFVISQNIYPPTEGFRADLVLPSAAFTEADGTLISGDGRIRHIKAAVPPPGEALPDWKILCLIARAMGAKGFDYTNVTDIQREMSEWVTGFDPGLAQETVALNLEGAFEASAVDGAPCSQPGSNGSFKLTAKTTEHTYHGIPLVSKVEGLRKLLGEDELELNPTDADLLKVRSGDKVVVTSALFERDWPVKVSPAQPRGVIRVTQSITAGSQQDACVVNLRKKDV
jgi:predicted molibdopterin-dependent oxidoreductase YjgC